jgi:AcrR family transcriptional regulator
MTATSPHTDGHRPQLGATPSTRERLLAAGKDFFSAEGYENTTTAAIARRAGTSESQLIKHFGSKEGLLEAILEAAWTRLDPGMRQVVQQADSAVRRLLSLCDFVLAALERDRKLRTLILLESRRVRKRAQQVLITNGFRRFVGLLDAALLEMQLKGLLRDGTPVEVVRSAWLGATEGLLRDQLLGDLMDFPARYTHQDVSQASRLVLAGFLTPAARRLLART